MIHVLDLHIKRVLKGSALDFVSLTRISIAVDGRKARNYIYEDKPSEILVMLVSSVIS